LEETPLIELFREGYAAVAKLQTRARALVESRWTEGRPRSVDLLDSPIGERVRALLGPRPLYVEVEGGGEPREFRSLAEIRETEAALDMAEVVGELLTRLLGPGFGAAAGNGPDGTAHPPRLSTYFLTLLARHASAGELSGNPLPRAVVADFLRNVASRRTAAPDAPERALESLLRALAERLRPTSREITLLRGFGRFCLERLAEECAALDPGVPVDRRYVSCLFIAD
jgi:hypothetical protein